MPWRGHGSRPFEGWYTSCIVSMPIRMSSVRRVAAMVNMLGGSVGRAIERLRIPRLAVQGGDFKEPDERLKETESDEQERE